MPTETNGAATWPLVGRARELERIRAARTEGTAPGVLISAPAGVGKSRVAREAVAAAEREGAVTGWVQGTRSAAAIPLAAFAELLPPDARSDDLLDLMRRSVAALRSRADGRPIAIGVDDAHSLDATSAALVLQLAVTRVAFVVVTVRVGEELPDAITSLWKDAGVPRLTLDALDEVETAQLVEQALGGMVEQRAGRWIYESSQGNVLYVRELLLGALETRSLVLERGLWRLARHPPLRESLGDLIAARMAGLDAAEREAIEVLAFGEPLPLALIVELAGADPVAAAEERRMVVVEPSDNGGLVRLAHPLYGEVVRYGLPEAWARELRLRLAALVGSSGQLAPSDSLRVARWLLDAGEEIGVPLLLDASRAAIQAGDADLGAGLAGLALDAGAGLPASLLLARAHAAHKRFEEAQIVLADARPRESDPDTALEYLELAISILFWGVRRDDLLVELFADAQTWWPDAVWQQRLHPLRLYVAAIDKPYGATVGLSGSILEDPDLKPEIRRQVESLYASDLFYVGRAQEGLALASRPPIDIPLAGPDDEFELEVWTELALETGADWKALDARLSEMVRAAVRADDYAAVGLASRVLGGLRAYEGEYVEAARWLAEAELRLERHDAYRNLPSARAMQLMVARALGDTPGVEAALVRCRDALAGRDPLPGQQPYVIRAEAWALHARGDVDGAQQLLFETARELVPMPAYAAQLAYDAMRAGLPAAAIAEPLAGYAAACDAQLTAALAAHVTARAAGDGAALMHASEALAAIGARVYAMEAAGHAAEVFGEAGRDDSARRAAARAAELHAGMTGIAAPAIRGFEGEADALTARERQLVELAREGLSNAEIAERLSLSVRTVESHLYRAMAKLGVSDRRSL